MSFFKDFKEGAKEFGETIGIVVNSVLLTFVYFIGVGITSIIAKVFDKHFLEEKKKSGSYWKELNLTTNKMEEYYKQF